MKKVLCIIESLGSGGAERQISHLAVQLTNSAYDVEVAYYRKLEFYLSYLKENHVKASFLEAASNPKVRLFALWRYIRQPNPLDCRDELLFWHKRTITLSRLLYKRLPVA